MRATDHDEQFHRAKHTRIEDEIGRRGIVLRGRGHHRFGACPRCGGEDRFSINTFKQIFRCRQCNANGGDVIALVQWLDACGFGEALTTLAGHEPAPRSDSREFPPAVTALGRRARAQSPPNGRGNGAYHAVASWVYQDVDETPFLKVDRIEANGRKSYPQSHWAGGKWVKGKPAGQRIPYRLPQLLDSDRTEPVYITEGEKCADAVAALGLTATTASEGAGKWTPDLDEWFRDRIVVVLPDNDEPGRKHAEGVATALRGVAHSVRVVPLPGLAPGEDVYEWLAQGHTADELDELARQIPEYQPPEPDYKPLRTLLINITAWDDGEPPDQEWGVYNRFPARQTGILSGEGAIGKSSTLLHCCASFTIRYMDWLGAVLDHGPALFIDCEDELQVLWRRLAPIARFHQVRFGDYIKGGLKLISLVEHDPVLAYATRSGKIEVTPRYNELLEMAGDLKPKCIAIASSANVYAGSEIDRAQVQQFSGRLTRIARTANGIVLLAQHPSLTGINSDSGLSGSTQWHNAVRARGYMKGVQPAADEQPDSDLREIIFKKNQYGKTDDSIVLQWQNGLFLPLPGAPSLSKAAQEETAGQLFIDLLDRFARENRNVSVNPGRSYAPSLFAAEEEAKHARISAKQFADAMRRHFKSGAIVNESCGRPSRPRFRIARKS